MQATDLTATRRDAAVVTAVHVARDWAIERHGSGITAGNATARYMRGWLIRNGATNRLEPPALAEIAGELIDAVDQLVYLAEGNDPLLMVDDDYRGTSIEAHDMLQAQYERGLTHALSRITWKD